MCVIKTISHVSMAYFVQSAEKQSRNFYFTYVHKLVNSAIMLLFKSIIDVLLEY